MASWRIRQEIPQTHIPPSMAHNRIRLDNHPTLTLTILGLGCDAWNARPHRRC